MSSSADIADSATAVQDMLTIAEQQIGPDLPDWYRNLREQIHGLVTAAAWAVGESDGAAIVGFRCEGRTHSAACVAYRAASTTYWDTSPLVECPKCKAQVHSLFEAGPTPYSCWPCRKEQGD